MKKHLFFLLFLCNECYSQSQISFTQFSSSSQIIQPDAVHLHNGIRSGDSLLYFQSSAEEKLPFSSFSTNGLSSSFKSVLELLPGSPTTEKALDASPLWMATVNSPHSLFSSANLTEHLIKFSGFSDRGEIIYNAKHQIAGFEFYEHELFNTAGQTLPIRVVHSSNSIAPEYSAAPGNGVLINQQAVYREEWRGTDNSVWAALVAPVSNEVGSFTIYTNSNLAGSAGSGAFVINTNGNDFSFSANASVGTIGWTTENRKMVLSASSIETNGTFTTKSLVAAFNGDIEMLQVSENIQGYFGSVSNASTGLLIENLSSGSKSAAGITIRHPSGSNWIGTYSLSQNSSNDLPLGALEIKSEGLGGILLSTTSNLLGEAGSVRFAVNGTHLATFVSGSFLLGTHIQDNSSILTIDSDSRGVLLPRLSSVQRKAIADPKNGLILFDTDINKLCFYNGNRWEKVCSQVID